MPIETIENHTLEQFRKQLALMDDCIVRASDGADPARWDAGDLDYVTEQLGKARRYLFAALAVAEAQNASLAGFKIHEVRSEVQ